MFDDRSPIYRQLADQVKADVVSGTLGGDEQVMSTNQYAAYYRINPATVAKAFQQLVDEQVLYKKRGIGMFVSPTARDALRARRRETFFSDVVDPMVAEAKAVGIPIDEVVARIKQLEGEGRPVTLDIEVAGLRLRYGAVTALDDLSVNLPGGRIYGLLGRNGSGKTSLLSVLAGFRKASEGTVLVGGQPVFENPEVTRRVCLIRETGDTGDRDDRVRDALYTAAHLRPGWDGDYADSLIDRFQIPRRKKLGELSLGQRSALGMTFGLASRAPVTLFDESHLGMDAPSRAAFHDELLSDFMAHPRTIVISTHLIDELSPLFEEVVIIDNGRLVLQDETEALRARGADVTGPAEAVDRFVAGHTVLRERRLGRTKSAMVYGGLDERHRRQAHDAGLDLGPVALQDLFVHLTEPTGGPR